MSNLDLLIMRYPHLECCKGNIIIAFEFIRDCYKNGGKLLVCGNGGSASDAEHIVGELMKGFKKARHLASIEVEKLVEIDSLMGRTLADNLQGALPAIALDGHPALTTAYMNDCEPIICFAQQVYGYGCKNDVLFAISTSGNSRNVLYAVVAAKAKGMVVIGLTGENDSKLSAMSDVCIRVPSTETYQIQELHLPIYHCLCLMLEDYFFNSTTVQRNFLRHDLN